MKMKINRRKMFGMFAAIPVAALASSKKTSKTSAVSSNSIFIKAKGIWVYWTGWKPGQNNDQLVGQWVAYTDKIEDGLIYSCTTGSCRRCNYGDIFDIGLKEGIPCINHRSSESVKNHVKTLAYERLIEAL